MKLNKGGWRSAPGGQLLYSKLWVCLTCTSEVSNLVTERETLLQNLHILLHLHFCLSCKPVSGSLIRWANEKFFKSKIKPRPFAVCNFLYMQGINFWLCFSTPVVTCTSQAIFSLQGGERDPSMTWMPNGTLKIAT